MPLLTKSKRNKGKDKRKQDEPERPIQQKEEEQSFFLLAKPDRNSANKQLKWYWGNLIKFFRTFYKDDQEQSISPPEFLYHTIRHGFIGSRQTLLSFLNQVYENNQEKHASLSDYQGGLYLYKVSKFQTDIVIWPDQDCYTDAYSTTMLIQAAANMCTEIKFVISSQDSEQLLALDSANAKHETLDLTREFVMKSQQSVTLSPIQKQRISSSGTILRLQYAEERTSYKNTADVFMWISDAHRKRVSVQFDAQLWQRIKEQRQEAVPELAAICGLYPKLGLRLHQEVVNGSTSGVSKVIDDIKEWYLSRNLNIKCQVEKVEYDESTQNISVNVLSVAARYLEAYSMAKQDQVKIVLDEQLKDHYILEIFWGRQGSHITVSEHQGSTYIVDSHQNVLWQEKTSFDLASYSSKSDVLLLYSAKQKIIQCLLSKYENQQHKFLVGHKISLNNVDGQIVNMQFLYKQMGTSEVFLECEDTLILISPLHGKVVKQLAKDKDAFYMPAPSEEIFFKVYRKDDDWNIDIFSLATFEVIQQVKKFEPLQDLDPKTASFTIFWDMATGKQFLAACGHDYGYNVYQFKVEIVQISGMQAVRSVIPNDPDILHKNVQIMVQSEDIKEQIQQQGGNNFTVKMWDEFSPQQLDVQETELDQYKEGVQKLILPVLTGQLEQQEMIAGLKGENYNEGDLVWYFNSKKIWVEAQVQKVTESEQQIVYEVGYQSEKEETTNSNNLQPRYARLNTKLDMYNTYAAYSQLVNASLEKADDAFKKQECVSKLEETFNQVAEYVSNSLVPQDCLACLYEPFIRVSFLPGSWTSTQAMLKYLIDSYPLNLKLPVLQPPFQPPITHLLMIVQFYYCAAEDAFRNNAHQNLFDIYSQLESFLSQERITKQFPFMLSTFHAQFDPLQQETKIKIEVQEQENEEKLREIQSNQSLAPTEFLAYAYEKFAPDGISRNTRASIKQQLKSAKVHFSPNEIKDAFRQKLYREISAILDSKM